MGSSIDYYQPETAGSIMVTTVPIVRMQERIRDAVSFLRSKAGEFETLNYVYVTDDTGVLKGTVSLKTLLTADSDSLISNVMHTGLVIAREADDQERVAQLALQHQLKAVPVVNFEDIFLGVVPSHVILQILQQEHEEDILTEAGVPREVLQQKNQGIFRQVGHRLPWLMLGAVGGVAAALIVRLFEGALAEEVLLAAFIPTIVYLADAVGVQVQTVYIRFTTSEKVPHITRYLLKEIAISFAIACVLGAMTFGLVLVWFDSLALSLIVATSAAVGIVFASIIAVVLPWLFQKFRLDPAVASGPFATIIRDIASIGIYFLFARYLLHLFV